MKPMLSIGMLAFALAVLVLPGCSASEEAATTATPNPTEVARTEPQPAPTSEPPAIPADTQAPETVTPPPPPPVPQDVQVTPPEETRAQEKTRTGIMMWSVQIGAFKNEAGATQLLNEAKAKVQFPVYKDYDPVSGLYKVSVGSFQTRDQAAKFKADVQAKGYPDAFVVEARR